LCTSRKKSDPRGKKKKDENLCERTAGSLASKRCLPGGGKKGSRPAPSRGGKKERRDQKKQKQGNFLGGLISFSGKKGSREYLSRIQKKKKRGRSPNAGEGKKRKDGRTSLRMEQSSSRRSRGKKKKNKKKKKIKGKTLERGKTHLTCSQREKGSKSSPFKTEKKTKKGKKTGEILRKGEDVP